MVDIVTRAGKGSPLTNNEVDANFTNLAEVAGVTGEPMGHEDRTTSTISFNASTRTFTIAPVSSSFTVWCKGKKVVVSSAQTVTIPNTTGMYSIYFDANGALAAKAGYFTFSSEAPTAYIYWNAEAGTCPYFGDERHGVVLDWQTHEYLHRTRGAALASGFAASGYTLGGNGSSNAHAQLTLEGGTFFDEDMKIIVTATNTPTAGTWEQDLLSPARIPVLYLSGTSWVIDAPTDYPLKQGTSRPRYNAYSAGVWSTADVANNKYATSWILATNNLTYPVIAIIGQAESDLQSAAEAVDFTSLQLPGFPSVEFRPLYKLVFQCADSFSNAVKASLVSITDIRSIAAASTAASLVTDHGNLTGLSDDDHPQYLSVDTVRTSLTAAVKASFLPSQTGNTGGFLTTDGTATSWAALTSSNITTALGFTPYNATNPSGYISGISSSDVTTALGFTPYNATNPSGYVTAAGARGAISVTGAGSYDSATGVINIVGGVTSFNTRTGAITLSSADVTNALGFTPYNSTNPNGYLTGITSMQVTTALGYTPYNSSNPSGYITGITSGMVTTALGYTPYNSSNPSGYITSSALSGYLTSSTAASTYLPLGGGTLSGNLYANSEIRLNAANTARIGWRPAGSGTLALGLPFALNASTGAINIEASDNDSGGLMIDNEGVTVYGAGDSTGYVFRVIDEDVYQANGNSVANATQFWVGQDSGTSGFRNQLTIASYTALHAGNYTSYSPSLTGSGASGTWGISITGNSASVAGLTPAQFFNNMGNNHGTYTDFNSVPGFGNYYVQAGTNSPTGVGAHQWYGFTLGLGNEYALSSYGSQMYYPRRAQNSDTYIYVRDKEGGSWTSWTKIKAGYADTAGSATDSSKLPLTGGTMTGHIAHVRGSHNYFERSSGVAVGAIGWHTDDSFYVAGHPGYGGGAGNDVRIYGFGNALRFGNSTYGDVASIASGQLQIARRYGQATIQGVTGSSGSDSQMIIDSGSGQYLYLNHYNGGPVVAEGGNRVLNASNYTSYSPSLSGNYKNISVGGLYSRYNYNESAWITDSTSAYTLSPDYGQTTVAMHNGHGMFNNWATTLTMSGYERYGAYQISGNYNTTTAELAMRNYNQGLSGWTSWTKLLSSANYSSYALPLSGGTLSGTLTVPSGPNGLVVAGSGNISFYTNEINANSGGTNGSLYLGYRGTNQVYVRGSNVILGTDNFSSYALPVSGGSVTGYTNFNVGVTVNSGSGAGYGINLYSGNSYQPTYGLFFAHTANFGTYGNVTSDWSTYFTMNDDTSRGWIFRRGGTNVASISGGGVLSLAGAAQLGGYGSAGSALRLNWPHSAYIDLWGSGAQTLNIGSTSGLNVVVKTTGAITENSAGGGGLRVLNPTGAGNGGSWGSGVTGCFKIRLPQSWSSTMLRMTVRVYTYDEQSFDIYLGGYNYGGGYWVNTFAYMDTMSRGALNVRFGHDGSYACIYIGETNSVWQYPQVFVTDAQFGYNAYDSTQWGLNWAVTLETTQLNVGSTKTVYPQLHAGNYSAYTVPVSGGTFTGSITSNGNVTAYSDERKKTNWRDYAADFIEQLARVKNGTYDRIDMTMTQDGVSAQSLRLVMPNSVSTDAAGMLSVNYGGAALASAVELAKRVVEQEARIAKLESLINQLTGE